MRVLSDRIHLDIFGAVPEYANDRQLKKTLGDLADAVDTSEVFNPETVGPVADLLALASSDLPDIQAFIDHPIGPVPHGMPSGPGWFKWVGYWVASEPPTGPMVLDFETMPQVEGSRVWQPTVCGVWADTWFIWTCDPENPVSVIPFGTDCTVIGHNVGYDRGYLAPEYLQKPSGNEFIDTMGLWVATRGMCNQQRALFKSSDMTPEWQKETTTNGLDAVYAFYFPGETLDKGVRADIVATGEGFLEGTHGLETVKGFLTAFRSQIGLYCLSDIGATFRVLGKLYPEYQAATLARFPRRPIGS
jgi:DNA mitochondrial polymerase exonuclease domain